VQCWISSGCQALHDWKVRSSLGAAFRAGRHHGNLHPVFIKAIQSAEHRLWIASPYFVPDEQFITALQLAVLKGVDVRLLIPRKTDNQLVTLTFVCGQ
jgi:phosphatidylserine/phosphatidylglycerophosphate/cardiolipin synthase-like enzyme